MHAGLTDASGCVQDLVHVAINFLHFGGTAPPADDLPPLPFQFHPLQLPAGYTLDRSAYVGWWGTKVWGFI